METKLHHLSLIQQVVERHARASFLLKGWSVVLVSALFALSSSEADRTIAILAILPCVMFWGLDGYYLWQERLYRKLYVHVCEQIAPTDLSLNASTFKGDSATWFRSTTSITILWFYATLLVSISVVFCSLT